MKDDELLSERARAHDRPEEKSPPDDARADALASGDATPPERNTLTAKHAGDPVLRKAIVAPMPPGDASQAGTLARIAREASAHESATGRAKLHRPRWRRVPAIAATSLAMAAAVVLVARHGYDDGAQSQAPVGETVAPYDLEIHGGQQARRGSDDSAPPSASDVPRVVIGPDSDVFIALHPHDDVPRSHRGPAVALQAFLVRDGHAEPWAPYTQIAFSGGLALEHVTRANVGGADGLVDALLIVTPATARTMATPNERPNGAREFHILFELTSR